MIVEAIREYTKIWLWKINNDKDFDLRADEGLKERIAAKWRVPKEVLNRA